MVKILQQAEIQIKRASLFPQGNRFGLTD